MMGRRIIKATFVFGIGLVSGFSPAPPRHLGVHSISVTTSATSDFFPRTPVLFANSAGEELTSFSSRELDGEAVIKYGIAAAVQLSCFSGAFYTIDRLLETLQLTGSIPTPVIVFLFYAISLKSRVFNPLNNQRPDRAKAISSSDDKDKSTAGFRDRVMPSWTPPGVVFPIMWLLIIGPIRAYSSTLIVQSNAGLFFTPETMAIILHLTIGDVWNTVNNTEKRYGAAVVGVLGVVLSALFAAKQYYDAVPLAGQLLGGTCIWLVTAAALITDTWRLNPDQDGTRDALYPTKRPGVDGSVTKFAWFTSE